MGDGVGAFSSAACFQPLAVLVNTYARRGLAAIVVGAILLIIALVMERAGRRTSGSDPAAPRGPFVLFTRRSSGTACRASVVT